MGPYAAWDKQANQARELYSIELCTWSTQSGSKGGGPGAELYRNGTLLLIFLCVLIKFENEFDQSASRIDFVHPISFRNAYKSETSSKFTIP